MDPVVDRLLMFNPSYCKDLVEVLWDLCNFTLNF